MPLPGGRAVPPVARVTARTAVLELLAPARCLGCRRRGTAVDAVWCERCRGEVIRAPRPACRRCAGPRHVGHGCWPPDAPVATTVAAAEYRGPVAAAVVAAKVAGARSAWPALAAHLAARVAQDPPPVEVVTAVATGRDRVRRRGVDHAAVLAVAVAEATGVPYAPLLTAEPLRGGGERQRPTRRLPATAVLLVDDVLTTGRTAWAAAAALRAAGADAVHLAVLARAGDHALRRPDRGRRPVRHAGPPPGRPERRPGDATSGDRP